MLALCLTGCVEQAVDGAETTFRYTYWLPVGVALAGSALTVLGWFLRKHLGGYGWTLMVCGPMVVFLAAPTMLFDRTRVDDRGFSMTAGFYGLGEPNELRFDKLKSVQITEVTHVNRWGTSVNDCLVFETKLGNTYPIELNNDLKRAAGELILAKVTEQGIAVLDKR
jgi:hypothetical protein